METEDIYKHFDKHIRKVSIDWNISLIDMVHLVNTVIILIIVKKKISPQELEMYLNSPHVGNMHAIIINELISPYINYMLDICEDKLKDI